MELPVLSRIVDTYVPVVSGDGDLAGYFNQLRRDVLPHIRKLQADRRLRWFSFLLHDANGLSGHQPPDGMLFIHLRLEPAADDIQAFIKLLPEHFKDPQHVNLPGITEFANSAFREGNSAQAWRIHGEASDWILSLLEGFEEGPKLQEVIQFLHYFTNPLMLGHRCLCIPAGFISF